MSEFDGQDDKLGPSSVSLDGLVETGSAISIITGAGLTPFIGGGTVFLPSTATGATSNKGCGNVSTRFITNAAVDVEVEYIFDANPAIDIEKATNGLDADSPTGPNIRAGDPVTWTYVVNNTGDVQLRDVVVTDDKIGVITGPDSGDTNNNGILEVTETWTYSANGTAQPGQYSNVSDVAGTPPTGGPVTDEDPSHYFGAVPEIDIEKATNGQDADSPTGPTIRVGDLVTWTYVVTNPGDLALSNVVVTDDKLGVISGPDSGDTNVNGVLDLIETWTYTATGTAQSGQYANVSDVIGDPPTGTPVTDEDPSHYFGGDPGIDIEKATNGQDADTPTGPSLLIGSPVTWTYVVTNNGNVPLSNVVVTDDIIGLIAGPASGDANNNSILETTEVWTYTAGGFAQAGQYANVSDVVGNPPTGAPVTDEDPSHYFGDSPGIDIEKATNGEDADAPRGPLIIIGSPVTWTYVVTNTGNVPLSNVVVTDDRLGVIAGPSSGDANSNGILETTEVWSYSATGQSVEGQYANNSTVVGDPPAGPQVRDEDPSHYFGPPTLSVPLPPNTGSAGLAGSASSQQSLAAALSVLFLSALAATTGAFVVARRQR